MSERPVTMGIRLDAIRGGHCDVSIFVGRAESARGHAGTVVLRVEEWEEIERRGTIAVDVIGRLGKPAWWGRAGNVPEEMDRDEAEAFAREVER
jgi:hypothetical protein